MPKAPIIWSKNSPRRMTVMKNRRTVKISIAETKPTNAIKNWPWRTWRRAVPGEKKPNRSGIWSVEDWIRYPVVATDRWKGFSWLLIIHPQTSVCSEKCSWWACWTFRWRPFALMMFDIDLTVTRFSALLPTSSRPSILESFRKRPSMVGRWEWA